MMLHIRDMGVGEEVDKKSETVPSNAPDETNINLTVS